MKENWMMDAKMAVVAACGMITAAFGWMGWLVIGWVACMAMDFLTGCLAAGKKGEWKSEIAREGLWHKAGMIIAVCVAGLTDWVMALIINNITAFEMPFTYTVLICPLVLVWYVLTELGSIIENAGRMGAPIPAFLTKIIAQLHNKAEKAGEGMTGEETTGEEQK